MRLKKYLAGAVTNPRALSLFEPGALRAMGRLHQDMPGHVRQVFASQPSLHLLEYLNTVPGSGPSIADPRSAAQLARQIPSYASKARRPMQEITVLRSLDVLTQHAVASGQTEFLEQALTGLNGWSPSLRQSIARRIPQQLEKTKQAQGLCHALRGTRPDKHDEPSFLSNLVRFQTDPGIKKLLQTNPPWQVAASVAPSPGNSLGDHLLRSALVCVMGSPLPIPNKMKYLHQAVEEVSRLDPRHKNCPVSLRNMLEKSEPQDLKGKIQQAVEKFSTGWDKLVTPKKMLKKQRDYLLVRDKEGNILAHQVTVSEALTKEAKTQGPKVGLTPPKTLAKPVAGMPGEFEFNTEDPEMREMVNEIALPRDPAVAHPHSKPTGKPRGRLRPNAKKKILPSSSVSGFTESLNHEVSIERHSEDYDVALY
jgi:hypothetical protein